MDQMTIRKLHTPDEMKDIERLERHIWGDDHPVPAHQTITAAKNGGVILGAYDGVQLIGFLYSFAGFNQGEVYLCSHQMGINPAHRNRGIGYQLKMAQANSARDLGYRKIRWTYDPLESRNAYLNIGKLGATCFDYIENCYGAMDDNFNRGLPSDRFWVTWSLDDIGVPREHKGPTRPEDIYKFSSLLRWRLQDGIPVPQGDPFDLEDMECHLVPIPRDFQTVKMSSHQAALQWRIFTRQLFSRAFEGGWAAVDVIRDEHVMHYVLKKRQDVNMRLGSSRSILS